MNALFILSTAALLVSSCLTYVYSNRTVSKGSWRKALVLYALISLLAAIAVRYFQAVRPDDLFKGAVLKFCASLPSVLFAFKAYSLKKTRFSFLIVCAIVLGLIADISINLSFFIGGAIFLVGHLFYDIAFVTEKRPGTKQIILWLGLSALVVIPLYLFREKIGSLGNAAGGLLYISLLISTVIFAYPLGTMCFMAALIFALSDGFMIVNIVTNGSMFMKILALAVYYGALLIYGALLWKRNESSVK